MIKRHQCSHVNRDLLPDKMIRIHDKLSRLSNAFATSDQAVISLLDDYYEKVKLWYSFAINDYIDMKEILRGPISMQGDYAHLIRTNGKDAYFKPKFKNHFTHYEITKLLHQPFTYSIRNNIAYYYSTRKDLKYNKEASQSFGIDLYGDVIVLPSCLIP